MMIPKMTILTDTAFNALWVDDIRDVPEDTESVRWTCARTAWEAIVKLELINFDIVSLDHDLASFIGYKELTGYDITVWLAERKQSGGHVPHDIRVHSANPVGVNNMLGVIDRYLQD